MSIINSSYVLYHIFTACRQVFGKDIILPHEGNLGLQNEAVTHSSSATLQSTETMEEVSSSICAGRYLAKELGAPYYETSVYTFFGVEQVPV